MSEPRIVIAGSADASRSDYWPPVAIDGARQAALGIALARARSRIVVYHRAFIEGDVVAGYASVPGAVSAALCGGTARGKAGPSARITQSQPDLPVTLIYFAVVTGWVAGFTSDLIFTELAKAEVTKTKIMS